MACLYDRMKSRIYDQFYANAKLIVCLSTSTSINLTDNQVQSSTSNADSMNKNSTVVNNKKGRKPKPKKFKSKTSSSGYDSMKSKAVKFKYLFTREDKRFEFVKGIPSKSEVFVGRVEVSYKPNFSKLWKTLVSYVLANFQFTHEKRRDVSAELNMFGSPSRVQVAKKLGKSLFERSLACAEYYVNHIFNDYDHRVVGLSGKVRLPILFLRFCGLLDQNQKSEQMSNSKSYLFITPKGFELPSEIETNQRPKNFAKLLRQGKVTKEDSFSRPRLIIKSHSDFLEQLVLLRNLFDIMDPTMNVDFDIQDQIPDRLSFLSCIASESDGRINVLMSDNHPSELDICETVLFQPSYTISGVPTHCKGSISYGIDSEMLDYLGLRYWESVFGEKGVTSTSRIEVSSVDGSAPRVHSLLNVVEDVHGTDTGE